MAAEQLCADLADEVGFSTLWAGEHVVLVDPRDQLTGQIDELRPDGP